VVASSFMNPAESRASQNPNRVRIFGSDQLSKAVAGQKWDRAKVVCTQPFNKVGRQHVLSLYKQCMSVTVVVSHLNVIVQSKKYVDFLYSASL